MKKVLLIILISFLGRDLIGQAITKRAGASVTVNDENLFVGKSFRVPAYTDTTAANLAVTLDSAGKLIFTYDVNGLWLRESNPKKWVEVGSGGGGSGGGIVSLGTTGNLCLTRINDSTYAVDTACLAALYLRRADSASAYVTPTRLKDTATVLRSLIGGGSTDTALIRTIVSDSLWTTNFYGKLYDSTTWNNLSSFTNNGGTFAVTSNKIVGSAGSGFMPSLDYNYYTGLERWKVVSKVKATSGAGGFGLGVRSTASFIVSNAIGWFNTSTGRVYLNLGLNYSTNDSSAVLSFSTDDYIILSVDRNKDVITVTARNATTNSTPVSLTYTYTFDLSSPVTTPNAGKFAIYSMGGDFTVDSLSITSKETKNAILGFGGDSKLAGYSSGYYSGRVSEIAGTYFKSTINVSGGGNITQDILNVVPEIIALNPKQFILNIGRNDSTAGVSAATTYANYDTIAARLTRVGIDVFHALPMYETVAGQGNLINHITSTYSADKIFDTYNPTKQPNTLNPDGIHPNAEGNRVVLNAILQKNVLAGANNVTTFRNGSGIINHGTHQDLGGTITENANIVTNSKIGKYIFINGDRLDYDTSSSKNNTYLLSANTNTGTHATFAGHGAGNNQSGDYVVGFAENALSNNSGDNVVGVGVSAASGNTKDDVTAVGNFAGYLQTGDWFTGTGKASGLLQTGNYVSLFGNNSGFSNAGNNVTAGGLSALYQNTKDNATSLGYLNGYGNTGEHYTGLGSNTSINNSFDYVTLIGVNPSATTSQQLVFKNGAYNWRLYHGSLTANRLDTIPDYSGVLVVSNGYGTAGQRLKSNGAGVAPTWVDTTTGVNLGNSDLTQTSATRTYSGGNQDLVFNGGGSASDLNVEYGSIVLTGLNSGINIQGDSIIIHPENGKIYIDTLSPSTDPLDSVVLITPNGELKQKAQSDLVWALTQSFRLGTSATRTTDVTLSNVTGFSANLLNGATYTFEAKLYTTSNVAGGVNYAIGGTATASSIIYEGLTTDAGLTTQSRAAAMATSVGNVTAVTAAYTVITGTIVCSATGSLTLQFAQNASNAATSTILAGSTFIVTRIN